MLDCGVATEASFTTISGDLDEIGGSLTRLIGSHLHVDHIGAAKDWVENTGATWMMHETSSEDIPAYNDWSLRAEALAAHAAANGAPSQFVSDLTNRWDRPHWYGTAIDPTDALADGDRIPLGDGRYLEVLYTPGHQRSHVCLIDSRTGLLFSGDHVLPRISPFVPYTGPEFDHLGDYLASIRLIKDRQIRLTHPAHGPDIERGAERANQIALHHESRLDDMVEYLENGPATAWQVMEHTFRPNLSFLQQRLAIQETLAHLEHLCVRGRARRIGTPTHWQYERTGR